MTSTRSSGAPISRRRAASIRGLREKDSGVPQNALVKFADQKFPSLEAREGALGDARVHKNHGNIPAALGFAQKIGPDFGFHDDHQAGADGAQSAADGHDPVERKIENAVGATQALASQALARFGSGGNKHGAARKLRFQALDKGLGGEHFADRNGVNPDGPGEAAARPTTSAGEEAEALAESARRLAAAPAAPGIVGRDNEHAQGGEDAIEEIHWEGDARSVNDPLCRAQGGYYSVSGAQTRTTSRTSWRHRDQTARCRYNFSLVAALCSWD